MFICTESRKGFGQKLIGLFKPSPELLGLELYQCSQACNSMQSVHKSSLNNTFDNTQLLVSLSL